MPTGQGSPADLDLIQRLAVNRDVKVTVRQLQDWRRLGIIDAPVVVWLGWGRGTESAYPATVENQVVRVHDCLKKSKRMDLVILALFGVGVTPNDKALFNAYGSYLDYLERTGRQRLALFDALGSADAASQHVRRFASSIGRDSPEMLERWNEQARARAKQERHQKDLATGERLHTTSREIRERDAVSFAEAFLDRQDGDMGPMFAAIGIDGSAIDEIERDGGVPDLPEMRRVIDSVSIEQLIGARDEVRRHWHMVADLLPNELSAYLNDHLDDPLSFGLVVANAILSALAMAQRMEGEEGESAVGGEHG